MKERPILFSAPMVRAILDGRKTVTRRIVSPAPPAWIDEFGFTAFTPLGSISGRGIYGADGPSEKFFPCRHGLVGDRLWVKETWGAGNIYDGRAPRDIPEGAGIAYAASGGVVGLKLRPSIFMRRWMSRLTLEITGVRVERLQSISEGDARAEGVEPRVGDGHRGYVPARDAFQSLWNDINGKRASWESNPWVWVIDFRRAA